MTTLIEDVVAREVLDSRGNPTVEVEVFLDGGAMGTRDRAVRRLDRRPRGGGAAGWRPDRYGGKGVLNAVRHVNDVDPAGAARAPMRWTRSASIGC